MKKLIGYVAGACSVVGYLICVCIFALAFMYIVDTVKDAHQEVRVDDASITAVASTAPMLTADEAVSTFIQEAGLDEMQQKALQAADQNGTMRIYYITNSSDQAYMEGQAVTVTACLRLTHRFGVSYERVDNKWVPYDWSWITDPELNPKAGTYGAYIDFDPGKSRFYKVEISYMEPTSKTVSSIPKVDISEIHTPFVDFHTGPMDYDAARFEENGVMFEYRYDGRDILLFVGYDDTMSINGYRLYPWTLDSIEPELSISTAM